MGWNDTTSTVSSITDSKGNTYTRAVGPTAGTALTQSIYYAKNIAAGSNTVTVTFNKTAAYPDVRVLEYSGADKTNPLDVTAGASGSADRNSGTATTTSANEMVFGAGMTFRHLQRAGKRIHQPGHHQFRRYRGRQELSAPQVVTTPRRPCERPLRG